MSTSSMRVMRAQMYWLNCLPSGEVFGDSTTCASKVRPDIQASQRNSTRIGFCVSLACCTASR